MRWQTGRRSQNVEDRRGMSLGGRGIAGLGGGGLILLVLIALLTGTNPLELLGQVTPSTSMVNPTVTGEISAEEQELADFSSVVLADTEDTWNALFSEMGRTYQEPGLVLYSGMVESACGYAQSAVGPFYCSGDQKVYLDLSFFDELHTRLGAPGDFAQAYVIAHEIGHHVQNLLGINDQVMAQRGRMSEKDFNRIMVRMELQADFLAGVWAHYANLEPGFLESGDVEEGMNAASAVGDDRIMKQTQGYIVPDAFTHGTSEQRVRWFKKGFTTGDINQGDTFGAAVL